MKKPPAASKELGVQVPNEIGHRVLSHGRHSRQATDLATLFSFGYRQYSFPDEDARPMLESVSFGDGLLEVVLGSETSTSDFSGDSAGIGASSLYACAVHGDARVRFVAHHVSGLDRCRVCPQQFNLSGSDCGENSSIFRSCAP